MKLLSAIAIAASLALTTPAFAIGGSAHQPTNTKPFKPQTPAAKKHKKVHKAHKANKAHKTAKAHKTVKPAKKPA